MLKSRVYAKQRDLAVFLYLVFRKCRCCLNLSLLSVRLSHCMYTTAAHHTSGRGVKERKTAWTVLTKLKGSHRREAANCSLFLPYSFLF